MRLGAFVGIVLTLALAGPATAADREPRGAIEVVTTSIAEVGDLIDAWGTYQPVGKSLRVDRVALRNVRADLKDGASRADRRGAKRFAMDTVACARRKISMVVAVERLHSADAEQREASEATLAAHDPDGPDAERIRELVDEAHEHMAVAATHRDAILPAVVHVHADPSDQAFAEAVAEWNAALAARDAAESALHEAHRLVDGQFDRPAA